LWKFSSIFKVYTVKILAIYHNSKGIKIIFFVKSDGFFSEMTYCAALGYGDFVNRPDKQKFYHVGCADLLAEIRNRVKPKLLVSGHIHEDAGAWTDGVTTFVNASICEVPIKKKDATVAGDNIYTPVTPPSVVDLERLK